MEDRSPLEKSSLEDELMKESQPSTSGTTRLSSGVRMQETKLSAWRIMLSDPDYTSEDLDSSSSSNIESSSEENLWKPVSKLPVNRPTLPLTEEDIRRSLEYAKKDVKRCDPMKEKFRIKLPGKSNYSKDKKIRSKSIMKKKSSSSGESSCERKGYKPRPVMRETSENEINLYVNNYKLGGEYPKFPRNLSQAARFWIINKLLVIHGDALSIRDISSHFDVDRQMFRKRNRSKLKGGPEYYGNLSPGEVNTSYARIIRTYGRGKDVWKYLKEEKRNSSDVSS